MNTRPIKRRARGYTFAEVLVASALLGLAIGGAVSLTATMNTQNVAALNLSMACNMHDNAARLWQLGLTDAEALALLPDTVDNANVQDVIVPSSTAVNKQFTFTSVTNTTLSTNVGVVEKTTCTGTVRNAIGGTNRTIAADVYRPKIR